MRRSRRSPSRSRTTLVGVDSVSPSVSVEKKSSATVLHYWGRCSAVSLVVQVDPGRDLDDQDEGDNQVDTCAERGPPAGIGDEMVSLLPEVLEAMPEVSSDEQPC